MSLFSKALRGFAVGATHTIARPLFDKDDRAWIRQTAAREREEEAEAAAAKAKAKAARAR